MAHSYIMQKKWEQKAAPITRRSLLHCNILFETDICYTLLFSDAEEISMAGTKYLVQLLSRRNFAIPS